MPELPEVEHFRHLLLPLLGGKLQVRVTSDKTPRTFPTEQEIDSIHDNVYLRNVSRKGKLLCLDLECIEEVQGQKHMFLFLHMGMTGRISTPDHVLPLKSLKESAYPPRYTCLVLENEASTAQASFSDPRRFGSVQLCTSQQEKFDELAPDALEEVDFHRMVNQSIGIKALLLDQKRVMSGVGNWVADEILYQSNLHPNQTHLSEQQARDLSRNLHLVLTEAIDCLKKNEPLPADWIFHRRWNKKSSKVIKDAQGRTVTFITAGGRTSAIVSKVQQIRRGKKPETNDTAEKKKKSRQKRTAGGKEKSPTNRKRSLRSETKKNKQESTPHPDSQVGTYF